MTYARLNWRHFQLSHLLGDGFFVATRSTWRARYTLRGTTRILELLDAVQMRARGS